MNDLLVGLNGGNAPTLDLIFMITLATLLPSMAVMMTSFARTIIMLFFTRSTTGVQQTPPNMILVGMALFLILYIMSPVIGKISEEAYQPYVRREVTQQKIADRMGGPLKEFVLRSTEKNALDRFIQMLRTDIRENVEGYSLTVVTLAFITSELERSSMSGFLTHLSFLLTDTVVATTPMLMGMVMLPPTMIVLPFRLLLFMTVDGWELLFSNITQSFRQNAGKEGRRV